MTELDRILARKFFQRPSNAAGKDMTQLTGIGDINPGALICDFAFDPCGYSMNGIIDGNHYSPEVIKKEKKPGSGVGCGGGR
jgi:S-adenosylmethionine decarboxylase